MHRPALTAACLISAGAAFVASSAGAAPADTTGSSPICTRGETTVEVDPRGLLPLPANPIGPATTAALRLMTSLSKPQVISAALATVDHQRGGEAKFECGVRVWRRTVVVYVNLRAFKNSASLSEKVLFVGRFKSGFRVWQVVH